VAIPERLSGANFDELSGVISGYRRDEALSYVKLRWGKHLEVTPEDLTKALIIEGSWVTPK